MFLQLFSELLAATQLIIAVSISLCNRLLILLFIRCNLCKLSVALSLHTLPVGPPLRRSGVTCNLCKLSATHRLHKFLCQITLAQEWCHMQSVQTECGTQLYSFYYSFEYSFIRTQTQHQRAHRRDTDWTPTGHRAAGPSGAGRAWPCWVKRSLDRPPGSNGTGKTRWGFMECSLQPQQH